jgi:ribosomal protein S18 acetylase RimI-like enzyme
VSSERVRLASRADATSITELLAAFRDSLGKPAPSRDEIEASVRRILEEPSSEFLVAREGSRDAGIAQVRYRWSVWTTAEDCWLEDVFVREDCRRVGLGRALVVAVIARARNRGCRRIELDVDERNRSAIELYERVGFSRESKGRGRSLLMGLSLAR